MLKILLLFFCSILLFACRSKEKHQKQLVENTSNKQPVELEVKSFLKGKWQHYDAVTCKLALTNNTFWNIHYLNMSCSYNIAYCSNLPALIPEVDECNKNSPIIYTLDLYESNIRVVTFLFDSAATLPTHIPIRFGFHLVKAQYIDTADPLKALHDTSNIIWSKPIKL
jgi:hypothetical protein